MVSIISSRVVDCGFESLLGQTKHYDCGFEFLLGQTKHYDCGFEFLLGQTKHYDCGFESLLGQTKPYEIGICCFSTKHTALRSKNKTGWFESRYCVRVERHVYPGIVVSVI